MKKIVFTFYFLIAYINIYCQNNRQPFINIKDMQGVWSRKEGYVNDEIAKADEDYLKSYVINKSNIQLYISHFRKDNEVSTSLWYFGLCDIDDIETIKNVKDCKLKGKLYVEWGDNCVDKISQKITCGGRSTEITYNENGKSNADYYFVYWSGIPTTFKKINKIPDSVLVILKKNTKHWQKYVVFTGMKIEIIKTSKSIIYSNPNTPTKMYLIKGDEVEVLEEKEVNKIQWLKVRYYGKTTIEGWIKKSDVE